MKKLILLLFLFMFKYGSAETYYISTSGLDANDGKSPETAWKTLAKVKPFNFANNDSVLLKRGDVFNENFELLSNRTTKNFLHLGSYGIGVKPEVRAFGEFTDTNWVLYSSGIFRIPCSIQMFYRLWLNGVEKKESKTIEEINDEFPWKKINGYLYVKSPSNPSTYFSSIIYCSKLDYAFRLLLNENVSISGIKFTGGKYSILLQNSRNIIIENCEIGYRATYGISSASLVEYSANPVENIVIRNNQFETGNTLYYSYYRPAYGSNHSTMDGVLLDTGSSNCKVYSNYFNGWSHTAVAVVNTSSTISHSNEIFNNYITAPGLDYARGIEFDVKNGYNNKVYGNTIVNTSVRNQFNADGLKIFDNIIDGVSGCPYPEKPDAAQGISVEGYSSLDATNMEIYNNTIKNCAGYGIAIWSTNTTKRENIVVRDNNVFNCNVYQLMIQQAPSTKNNSYLNNHFVSSLAGNAVRRHGISYSVTEFNSIMTDNGDVISGNDAVLKFGAYTTTISDLRIEYNSTGTSKIINLEFPSIDKNGTKYPATYTLQPYSSVILLKDSNPLQPATEKKPIGVDGKIIGIKSQNIIFGI